MKKKNKPWYSSRFWVFVAFLIVLFSLIGYAFPYIVNFFCKDFEIYETGIPLETSSWCWMFVVISYTGCSQFENIMLTRRLPQGDYELGDLGKLRKINVASIILYFIAVMLNIIFKTNIGLEGYLMSCLSGIGMYVGGNKVIKGVGNTTTMEEK